MAKRIVVTKKKVAFKDFVVEDEVLGTYFSQYKDDPDALGQAVHRALRIGVLALEDERLTTLLQRLEQDLGVELSRLKEKIQAEIALDARVRGRRFETELVYEELEKLARVFDDTVEVIGDTEGAILGSKKGDLLVTLNPADVSGTSRTIVFEAKSGAVSKPQILEELIEAKANRGAACAVAVFDKDGIPGEAGVFRRYPEAGILCAIDTEVMETLPLEVAYKMARYEAILTVRRDEAAVDAVRISELMTQAESTLDTLGKVKSKITSSKRRLDDAADLLGEFQETLQHIFDEMETALREAA